MEEKNLSLGTEAEITTPETETTAAPDAETAVRFDALGLSDDITRAVALMGFETATPIQAQAIPVIRSGADLVARSQTGTGKTVAFGIPAIETVERSEVKTGIQVLILCPTRELAQQAAEELRKLARFLPDIRPVEIYGGAPIDKQCIRLRRANIVIGTPGRVMDHMRRKTIKLANLKMIVLDEADEMLSMGFQEDIETILKDTPEIHQTVLFSATMPPAIMALTKQYQHDPQLIEIDKSHVTLENIGQTYIDVPHSAKQGALDLLLQFYHPHRAIVFCNTKSMVDELTQHLNVTGFSAEGLHGDLKQAQRTTVMQAFKTGRVSILVATDIAARGIDVSGVDYVINFDIPQNTEYYIHRIGRTGRAGKSGVSITVCSSKREVMIMRNIARAVKSEINEVIVPTVGEIQKQSDKKALRKLEEAMLAEVSESNTAMLHELMEKGYSAEAIAAAALQLLNAQNAPKTEHLTDMPASRHSGAYGEGGHDSYSKKPRHGGKPGPHYFGGASHSGGRSFGARGDGKGKGNFGEGKGKGGFKKDRKPKY